MCNRHTLESIKQWEFVGNTPMNGKAYFNAESDLSAVVYGDTAKLYSNRILANGKTPVHFNDMTIIK